MSRRFFVLLVSALLALTGCAIGASGYTAPALVFIGCAAGLAAIFGR